MSMSQRYKVIPVRASPPRIEDHAHDVEKALNNGGKLAGLIPYAGSNYVGTIVVMELPPVIEVEPSRLRPDPLGPTR